jgi:hypothetical protein
MSLKETMLLAQNQQSPMNQLSLPQQAPQGLPHDIEGLAQYPFKLSFYSLILIGSLVLLAIIWYVYAKFFSKRKSKKIVQPEHSLLVLEKQLIALEPQKFTNDQEKIDYFYKLGLIFRNILEQAYDFPATDLTLKELYSPLKNKVTLEQDEIEKLISFFERCELIKFAQSHTDSIEAQKYYQQSVDWSQQIIKSVLQPEVAPSQQNNTL